MKRPEVSVVMSVYNGEESLRETVDSVLSQQGVDFEFIIIDDGSTDGSPEILRHYSDKNSRIRVINQENSGLTKALIRGCSEAKGKYIARQDCGDLSLPDRLKEELRVIRHDPNTVLVSCGTRFVGPKGEHLFDTLQEAAHATDDLLVLDARKLRGPSHHGSTLFRRKTYMAVGGYRHQFHLAQDIDLWVRLAERGYHSVVSEILYEAECSLRGVSAGRTVYQKKLLQIITQGARLRRNRRDEDAVLVSAEVFSKKARLTKGNNGQAAYFLGTCLLQRDSAKAREYFGKALAENPFHFKAFFRYFQSILTRV